MTSDAPKLPTDPVLTDPNPDERDPGEPFSHYLQVLRGSVRPVVTLLLVVAMVSAFGFVVLKKELTSDVLVGIVMGVTNMASTVVGVWFGQRK